MVVSGSISVPSAHGTVQLLVIGQSALNNATAFETALTAAQSGGTLQIVDLDTPPVPAPIAGDTVEYSVSQKNLSAAIPTGGAYVLDYTNGATTLAGSGAGDNVLAAQAGAAAAGLTYIDKGGNNAIVFVSGNNLYEGASVGGASAADTITAGQGRDTINTGSNSATVFVGGGQALITLNDTQAGVQNDVVYLDSGSNTVNAYGADDAIAVSVAGQTINAGPIASDRDVITVGATQTGAYGGATIHGGAAQTSVFLQAGGNLIDAQSGTMTVVDNGGSNTIEGGAGTLAEIDQVGGNLITGGAGTLFVISTPTTAGAAGTDTIKAGAGMTDIFGSTAAAPATSAYDVLSATGQLVSFIAGAGLETVGAAGSAGTLNVFGSAGGSLNIAGGSGTLNFIGSGTAAAPAADTVSITTGAGLARIFAGSGDNVAVQGQAGTALFLAGAGNETLNASLYTGTADFFASNPPDSVGGMAIGDSMVGGSGINFFQTGAGMETIVAGHGFNNLQLNHTLDGLGGMITVYGFSANDIVTFNGFTTIEENEAIRSATASTGALVGTVLTLSDNSSVLFVDVNVGAIKFSK